MDIFFQLQLICEFIIFLSVVMMHVVKRNSVLATIYLLQSITVILLLSIQAYREASLGLFSVVMCMLIVKAIVAPRVFLRFIHRSHLNLSATTYLTIPMTLGVLTLLTFLGQSDVFTPLVVLVPHAAQLRLFLTGSILMSLFLIINRKGALSQIIAVLSLENCIFAFGNFLGVKQSFSLELGILFDVFFWIFISNAFIAMLFRHYGSLDVTGLKQLKK